MGSLGPKERATFSIDAETKQKLEDAVPKSKRSQYVEQAIEAALREDARKAFGKFLDDLPKVEGGESLTDYIRQRRMELDGRPLDVLEGRKQ